MPVGFVVNGRTYEIGAGSFLKSFFSTVYIRLEKGQWGSRFPTLMNTLYGGVLPANKAAEALRELDAVEKDLATLKPSEVVWDFDNLAAQPPWGTNIAPRITSMANYFVTSDGRDFLSVARQALRDSHEADASVVIE